jgi:hypothetical protein
MSAGAAHGDLLAGRPRLLVLADDTLDADLLPHVDRGALLRLEAAFAVHAADPMLAAHIVYARADTVDPLLDLVAAKIALHRDGSAPRNRQELAGLLGADSSEVKGFLDLPPVLRRTVPLRERPSKTDRIVLLAERYRQSRGLRRAAPIPEELRSTATEADFPELLRMLAGSKPVSMFGDFAPEELFQPHVDRGAILRLDLAFNEVPLGVLSIPHTFYALSGSLGILRKAIGLQRALARGERLPDAAFERDLSRALGYSEEDIARYQSGSSGSSTGIAGPSSRSRS